MRILFDMADISHSLTVNSTGQSGQPLHPNYQDQTRLWLYGDFKQSTMNEIDMLDRKYSLLILEAAK
jgi:acyl-homoserine lactone acylase PvdQ